MTTLIVCLGVIQALILAWLFLLHDELRRRTASQINVNKLHYDYVRSVHTQVQDIERAARGWSK
jgi:hypothetical protein